MNDLHKARDVAAHRARVRLQDVKIEFGNLLGDSEVLWGVEIWLGRLNPSRKAYSVVRGRASRLEDAVADAVAEAQILRDGVDREFDRVWADLMDDEKIFVTSNEERIVPNDAVAKRILLRLTDDGLFGRVGDTFFRTDFGTAVARYGRSKEKSSW